MNYRRGDFPLTDQWSRRILSLPFFPEMKESEMEEVAEGIGNFFENE
jgi:dTDP-4-amino-4,6-dideoxygalactose transaminase